MNKNLTYLSHTQNTSPAKLSFSFSRTQRFQQLKPQSPAKFYEKKDQRSRRATSMGFGHKSKIYNKNSGDPGLYNIQRSFDLNRSRMTSRSTTFGISHNELYQKDLSSKMKIPGPGNYNINDKPSSKSFIIGEKLKQLNKLSQLTHLGPQTYNLNPEALEKFSKFKMHKGFRIKTQASGLARYDLSKFDTSTPGPNQYAPEGGMTIESLMKNRKIRGAGRFNKQQRIKKEKNNRLGPGSYQIFSVFGSQEQ